MKNIYSTWLIALAAMMATACSSDFDEDRNVGYLKLELGTLVSTNTRAADAPEDYAPKTLDVTIEGQDVTLQGRYENGEMTGDQLRGNIPLKPGTYTITAHSAGWDGSNSGFDTPFYHGRTTVNVEPGVIKTASVTCTQANVKVTVNWDESFTKNFQTATSEVSSAIQGVTPRRFDMGTTPSGQAAYFPAGSLSVRLSVVNKNGKSFEQTNDITDVKARDHCIINYKVAEGGGGSITVTIDDKTNSYIYDIEIPCGSDEREEEPNLSVTPEPANPNNPVLARGK